MNRHFSVNSRLRAADQSEPRARKRQGPLHPLLSRLRAADQSERKGLRSGFFP